MSEKVITINSKNVWNDFWVVFIIFPFIQQRSYGEYPSIIWTGYRAWMVVSSIFVIVAAICKSRKLKIPKEVLPLVIFFGVYILTTLIKTPSTIFSTVGFTVPHCIYVLFLCYQFRYHYKNILRLLSFVYGMYIYLNFILDLFFPNGIFVSRVTYHHMHLLGDDNALAYLMIPGIICMFCYSLAAYGKIRWYAWLAALLCDYTLISVWSVSGMVCMTLFIILVFIGQKSNMFRIPSWVLFGIFIGVVVVCFLGLANPYVQSFIGNVLKKSVTLSGRTIIWNQAYEIIEQNWLTGCGGYWRVGRFLFNGMLYPCHTPYLQILIDGGVVLFSLFIICIILAFKRSKNTKHSLLLYAAIAGLTCMLINYITEYSQLYHFYVIYLLIIYSCKLKESFPKTETLKNLDVSVARI